MPQQTCADSPALPIRLQLDFKHLVAIVRVTSPQPADGLPVDLDHLKTTLNPLAQKGGVLVLRIPATKLLTDQRTITKLMKPPEIGLFTETGTAALQVGKTVQSMLPVMSSPNRHA